MRWVASLGMFLTRNTKQVAISTTLASLLNIALNFWLIPVWGMMAAAYSTLISFVILHYITNYLSDKFYKIDFENIKLIILLLLGIILYMIAYQFEDSSLLVKLAAKVVVAISFPLLLYIFKFYDAVELQMLRGFYKKWKNPVDWKDNIKFELNKSIKR
jgi:O-antigen/teichoic acid export membrane protein